MTFQQMNLHAAWRVQERGVFLLTGKPFKAITFYSYLKLCLPARL